MSEQAGQDSASDPGTSTPAGSVAQDVANAFSSRPRRLSTPLPSQTSWPESPSTGASPTSSSATSSDSAAAAGLDVPKPDSAVQSPPSFAPAGNRGTTDVSPLETPTSAGTTDPWATPDPAAAPTAGHLGSVTSLALTPKPGATAAKSPTRRRAPRQTRKARLRISRVDPWSVMKTALLFGVAGWIILVVAVWVVFTVLDMTGIYSAINDTVAQVFASPTSGSQFNIKDYVNTTRATALAALIGAVDVILLTALATIFAFLYNLSANVMGGVEVTLAED